MKTLHVARKPVSFGAKENRGFSGTHSRRWHLIYGAEAAKEAQLRVVAALILLAAAKVATVYIPIVYGDIVDAAETGRMRLSFCPLH